MTDRNDPPATVPPSGSIGARLREARERLGLTPAEAAARMRVPLAIVEAVERDDVQRLGAPVYARGYLASYARLVGLPPVVVDTALARVEVVPPPLHSANHVSHARFLVERYARRAVYIVLTASIVIPVVWLATEERLPVQPLSLRSLDAPVSPLPLTEVGLATVSGPVEPVGPPESLAGGGPVQLESTEDRPVMASFTPFLGARTSPRPEPASDSGWRLVFSGDSWVEIIAHDGRRLEFGVIRGGSERRYEAGSVARVALGNASVVEVIRDGQRVSLAPYQRANVARFAVSSGGELLPAGG